MLRRLDSLRHWEIFARDGRAGKIDDFYFDDHHWVVRYLVADTGLWLSGRKVLIAPQALGKPDWPNRTLLVNLTREQIEKSPDVAADQPVSRQKETELYRYYGWESPYWLTVGHQTGPTPPIPPAQSPLQPAGGPFPVRSKEEIDPRLRSVRELIGYRMRGRDEAAGSIADLLADDEDWSIRYLLVDTGHWLPGRKVLIPPTEARELHWEDKTIDVDLSREKIRDSPEYEPSAPVEGDYQDRLHNFFGWPKYWRRR